MGRMISVAVFGAVGIAILVSLGVWQLQRLGWKEGILAEIEARIADAPVALPEAPDPEADRYLPVAVSGRIGAETLRVLVSQRGIGAGYRLISVLETGDGRRVLLDRAAAGDERGHSQRSPELRGDMVFAGAGLVGDDSVSALAYQAATRLGDTCADALYLDPGAGPGADLRRHDADGIGARWRALRARDAAQDECGRNRGAGGPVLRGGRVPRDAALRGREFHRCGIRRLHRAGLCGVRPCRAGAAEAIAGQSFPARAVPRADAGLQGFRDAADRPAVPDGAGAVGRAGDDRGGHERGYRIAAMEAFRGLENVDVFILYPHGRVSCSAAR